MKRVLSAFKSLILYFCFATLLAQSIGLAMLWHKGYLTRDRVYNVLASLYDIDVIQLRDRIVAEAESEDQEDSGIDSRLDEHLRRSLDLDLRDMAIEKGFRDLRNLELALKIEHSQFVEVRDKYDEKLVSLLNESRDAALLKLRQTLETMQPLQAKDQLLRMFEDGAVNDVVKLLIDMPSEKQKKILAEFQSDEESQQLEEILKRIRLGEPTVSTIEQARAELDALNLSNVLQKQ